MLETIGPRCGSCALDDSSPAFDDSSWRETARGTGISLSTAAHREILRAALLPARGTMLVDTNVLSELRKGDGANAHVRTWFEEVSPEEICLSVLVIGELRRGADDRVADRWGRLAASRRALWSTR